MLTRLAMSKPRIRRVARKRQAQLRFPIKGGKLYLYGHNPLMRLGYRRHDRAEDRLHGRGRPLLRRASCGAASRRLGVVLLDSRDPSKQAPKLLDAAFAG